MAPLGEAYLACGKMQLRHPVITIEAHLVLRVERAPAARNANGYQYPVISRLGVLVPGFAAH
jgi:hypothetical protein